MTVYARQIAPEYQESPIYFPECFPDNITVCGNREFNEHKTELFERVYDGIKDGDLLRLIEEAENSDELDYEPNYNSAAEAISMELPKENGEYSEQEINDIHYWIEQYENGRNEQIALCNILSIVSGEEYDYRTITGCCQGDWNYIYYPVKEWSDEALRAFETEYFNEGTEWIIHDEESEPETAEDISGYSIYCVSYNVDGIRKEISEYTGEPIENIKLYQHDGYYKVSKYKEV